MIDLCFNLCYMNYSGFFRSRGSISMLGLDLNKFSVWICSLPAGENQRQLFYCSFIFTLVDNLVGIICCTRNRNEVAVC